MAYSASYEKFQLGATHIVSHPRLQEIVEELDGKPGNLSAANNDPPTFLKSKGFELSPEWVVSLAQGNSITIQACINSHCVQLSLGVHHT